MANPRLCCEGEKKKRCEDGWVCQGNAGQQLHEAVEMDQVIVTDEPHQHSIFFHFPRLLRWGKLQMIAYMFHKLNVYQIFPAHSQWI